MGNGYIDSYASGRFITDVISKIRQIIVKVKKNSEDLLTKADLIGGKLDPSQIPAITISDTFVVTSEVDMLALTAQIGDIAVRTDESKSYILQGSDSSILEHWILLAASSVSTLTQVLATDNITGSYDIKLTDGDRIVVNVNRAGFGKGYNDTLIGGSGGVSLYCAAGYELNWQAGWLTNYYATTIVPIMLRSPLSFTVGSYLASVNGTIAVSPDTRKLYDELGGSILTWTSTGVGVNQNTPAYMLDVNGTARIAGVITTTADAVINGIPIGKGGSNVSSNLRIGNNALNVNTSGGNNIAIGQYAGESNTTGASNVFIGRYSGAINDSGGNNVAVGYGAMYVNLSGSLNTAVGFQALNSNSIGYGNTAVGHQTLKVTAASYNTAFGMYALYNNTTGEYNTSIGFDALYDITTGSHNTVIGKSTGKGITTGSNNTIIGANVTELASNLSNNIIIADGAGNRRINVNSSGNVGIGTAAQTSKLHVVGLPVYADNTAALGGGLTEGAFYRTSTGTLMIAY